MRTTVHPELVWRTAVRMFRCAHTVWAFVWTGRCVWIVYLSIRRREWSRRWRDGVYGVAIYMEVGDQKFISRSSEGFALSTLGLLSSDKPVVWGTVVDGRCWFVEVLLVSCCCCCCWLCASSVSSLMFETTLFVDDATSLWSPSKPDRNQPPVALDVPDAPAVLVK